MKQTKTTELLVLRYLIENPTAFRDLRASDFSSLQSRELLKKIRQFEHPITEPELLSVTDSDTVEAIYNIPIPTNPEKQREMLIKQSLLSKVRRDGRGDLKDFFLVKEIAPETGEEVERWSNWFENASLTEISKQIAELNQARADNEQELIKLCRGVQTGFCKPCELPRALIEQEWLVDRIIMKNSFVEIIAPQKAGKSQLGYQLAGCVQNGIDFLGRGVMRQDVVYLDFEMEANEIYTRCEKLKRFTSECLDCSDYKDFRVMSLNKDTDTTLDTVLYLIREEKRKNPQLNLVIFDNFYSFCAGDTNNVSDVKDILKKVYQGVGKDITVVVINHTNKEIARSTKNKKISYYEILTAAFGSNAHGMFASDIIYIEPKTDGKVVWCAGRHISPEVEIPCFYGDKTNWFFLPDAAAAKQYQFQLTEAQKREVDDYLNSTNQNGIGTVGSKSWSNFKKKFPDYEEKILKNSGYQIATPERKKDRYINKVERRK